MKLWLDDERPAPEGWHHVYTAWQAIAWLNTGGVSDCSLDHDLGLDRNGTGQNVMDWIEQEAYYGRVKPFTIRIHTANPAAGKRMYQTLESIERFWKQSA